jgi:hypothetical protein
MASVLWDEFIASVAHDQTDCRRAGPQFPAVHVADDVTGLVRAVGDGRRPFFDLGRKSDAGERAVYNHEKHE